MLLLLVDLTPYLHQIVLLMWVTTWSYTLVRDNPKPLDDGGEIPKF